MTQSVFDPIVATETSGTELAGLLNNLRLSLLTNHSGAVRPSYVQPGQMWIDTSGTPWIFNFFDGSDDLKLFDINPSTNVIRLYHAGVVLGALATLSQVGSSEIADNAITTNKVNNGAITKGKMASASVGAGQIDSSEAGGILSALLSTTGLNHVLKGTGTGYTFGLPAVAGASGDSTPDYLINKILAGSLLQIESVDVSGNKKVRVKLANGTPGNIIGFDEDGLPAELPGVSDPDHPWVSYDPNFEGVGTVSDVEFIYQVVGKTLNIIGSFVSGVVSATEFRCSLPDGITTSPLIPSSLIHVGRMLIDATGTGFDYYVLAEPSKTYLVYGARVAAGTYNALTKANANTYLYGSTRYSFQASVPIA